MAQTERDRLRNKTPERREYKRLWRERKMKNPVFAAKNKERKKINQRKHQFKVKYNITIEEYDQMLIDQGGVCKICGTPPKKRLLAVDHCHKTKRVRGLLCYNCNYILGWWRDDAPRFRRAADYLDASATGIQNHSS